MKNSKQKVQPITVSNGIAKHHVGSSAGYVVAKCPNCKNKKKYEMDKPLNHTPWCDKCFAAPMIIDKVVC